MCHSILGGGGQSCVLAHAMNPGVKHVEQARIPILVLNLAQFGGETNVAKKPFLLAFLVLKGQLEVFFYLGSEISFVKSEFFRLLVQRGCAGVLRPTVAMPASGSRQEG